MVSFLVCDLAPELQTSEIPEGFMKHPVHNVTSQMASQRYEILKPHIILCQQLYHLGQPARS
jgi:hypothetical protein